MTRSRYGRRKLWMMIGTPIRDVWRLPALRSARVGGRLVPHARVVRYLRSWFLLWLVLFGLGNGDRRDLSRPFAALGLSRYCRRARRHYLCVIPAIMGLYGHTIDRFTMEIVAAVIIVLVLGGGMAIYRHHLRRRAASHAPHPCAVASLAQSVVREQTVPSVLLLLRGLHARRQRCQRDPRLFHERRYRKQLAIVGPGLFTVTIMTLVRRPLMAGGPPHNQDAATATSLLLTMLLYGGVTPLLGIRAARQRGISACSQSWGPRVRAS